jgi:hypothetical protein
MSESKVALDCPYGALESEHDDGAMMRPASLRESRV